MAKFLLTLACLLPLLAIADEAEPPSVAQNMEAMDTDHDGQITIIEIRAFLESQHGKGYQQALLDDMEEKAGAKSCASPFSKSYY
jgi:hypothetical protein